jgi:hypothetical protein
MGHLHGNEKTGAPQGHCVKCRVGMAEQQTLSGSKIITEDWISVLHYALFSLHMRSVCGSIFVGWERARKKMHPVAVCHAPAGDFKLSWVNILLNVKTVEHEDHCHMAAAS